MASDAYASEQSQLKVKSDERWAWIREETRAVKERKKHNMERKRELEENR